MVPGTAGLDFEYTGGGPRSYVVSATEGGRSNAHDAITITIAGTVIRREDITRALSTGIGARAVCPFFGCVSFSPVLRHARVEPLLAWTRRTGLAAEDETLR